MIYLDNAATAPVFASAIDAAERAMRTDFYNPNATYRAAVDARAAMERARSAVAATVGASSDEIILLHALPRRTIGRSSAAESASKATS